MDDSVLIVGGGIAGSALKRALGQRGIPAAIAERKPARTDGGLAINLPGNAVAAVNALGLGEDLLKLGRPVPRREYRNSKGRLLFAVDEAAFWGPDRLPRCVRRADLLTLLQGQDAALTAEPSSVASLQPIESGVEVTFADGRKQAHGFVVGADGVHSTVRTGVFGADKVRSALLSSSSWRFVAPNPGLDCWTVWTGPSGGVLMIPLDGDQLYGNAFLTGGNPSEPTRQWRTYFDDFAAPVPAILESLLDERASVYHSPIEEVRDSAWARDRCVLIGDAAHATAPVWAQGAALAMEDALVLAELLGESDWDDAGAQYEQRRRARVDHVQAVTDKFSRMARPSRIRSLLSPVMGPRAYRQTYLPLREPVTSAP